MSVKIGIDPGKGGGIAWSIEGGQAYATNMTDTPHDLARLFNELQQEGPVEVTIEEVGGFAGANMPGSRMFNFGRNFGEILGVCAALMIPVNMVKPQKWQKALSLGNSTGMTKTQWKNKLKSRAQQNYPHLTVTLKTADALLILNAAEKDLV